MTSSWHPDSDATPTPGEVDLMAGVLEGRHGVHAEDVAQFFIDWNAQKADASRCWAWAAVAERIRQRTSERVEMRQPVDKRRNASARRIG